MWIPFALLWACNGTPAPPTDTGPQAVAWSGGRVPAAEELANVRDFQPRRAIVHLHSTWSHDACDGDPRPDGARNEPCHQDLRRALCETAIDIAFLTDHPAHAAEADWEGLNFSEDGDERLLREGELIGRRIACEGGHRVLWLPGIEDELSWAALDTHVADTVEERDRLYNADGAEALGAGLAAGGTPFMAHTEQRSADKLASQQDLGLAAVEIFNLHAAFAPDIRRDYLGWDGTSWLVDVAPFVREDGDAEPDLLFLGVLAEQTPSVARWEELLARGPMGAVAGTDAHQNTLPMILRDGERGDSYRRMLRWFSNVLLVTDPSPEAAEAALRAGRSYISFDALGLPADLDVHLRDAAGNVHELGANAPAGTLVVRCPRLSASSPRSEESPEITASIFHNGELVASGCGEHAASAPGSWRVRFDLTPHHLRPFLGSGADAWIRPYPWVYTNAIRVQTP